MYGWRVPQLLKQLAGGGKLIAPVLEDGVETLVILENSTTGISQQIVCQVLSIYLRRLYGLERR